jgi:DNA-binding MarR family transcriptional regulator
MANKYLNMCLTVVATRRMIPTMVATRVRTHGLVGLELSVYQVLKKKLRERPNLAPSQREIADELGVNIATVNYAIQALKDKQVVGMVGKAPRSLFLIKPLIKPVRQS